MPCWRRLQMKIEVDTEEASLLAEHYRDRYLHGPGVDHRRMVYVARQIVLPEYVGAMIVAAIVRNVDDRLDLIGISQRHADMIGNISLSHVHRHGDARACGSGNWRIWPCQ